MDVISLASFRTGSLLWQQRPDLWALTVLCKATFELRPGEAVLAESQEPIHERDRHWSDDPAQSVRAPSDLVPFKPRADVVLVGHAFAPRGEPARSVVARLLVGEIDKSIEVHVDRSFTRDGALREGPPFTKMPLRYERAAGGPETSNPVGVRADARDIYGSMALPNLQPPGLFVAEPGTFIDPIGFGPIAPSWPQRRHALGRLAATFSLASWQNELYPADLGPGFWSSAPPDQQVGAIRDNERIILENLNSAHARLVTSLPGVHPRAFVDWGLAAMPRELSLTCDTLWIDADNALCTLTWRGVVPLQNPAQAGRVLIDMERPGQRLSWADFVRAAPAGAVSSFRAAAQGGSGAPPASDTPADSSMARAALRSTQAFVGEGSPGGGSPAMPFMRAAPGVASSAGAPGAPSAPPSKRAPLPRSTTSPVDPNAQPLGAMPSWVQQPSASPPAYSPPPAPSALQAAPQAPAYVMPPPPSSQAAPPASDSPWATGAPGAASSRVSAASRPPPIAQPASGQVAKEATGGAVAASNAAAAASGAPQAGSAAEPEAAPRVAAPAFERSTYRSELREYLELLWFEKAEARRLRGEKSWAAIFEGPKQDEWLDGDEAWKPRAEASERADVLRILTRAKPLSSEGIQAAIADAIDEDGTYHPPLALVTGELQLVFDEVETLKAHVTAASPFAGPDKKLRDILDAASEVLRSPWQNASGLCEGLVARIKEAFAQGNRSLPPQYLETSTERTLLEQRQYQTRVILGEPRIRALLTPAGGSGAIPTYLPQELGRKLPMFQRFRATVAAEVQGQQDQYESHTVALLVLALGRLLPMPSRGAR